MSFRRLRQYSSLFAPALTPIGVGERPIRIRNSLFQIPGGAIGQGQRIEVGWKDREYSGNGRLRVPSFDAVTKDGVPINFRIRIFDERSGVLVREVWSDGSGQWLVQNIRRDITYTVLCYDHTLKYDPIAYSGVLAEAMP